MQKRHTSSKAYSSSITDIDHWLRNPMCERLGHLLSTSSSLEAASVRHIPSNLRSLPPHFKAQSEQRFWSKLQQNNGRRIIQALREARLSVAFSSVTQLDSDKTKSINWLQGRFLDPSKLGSIALCPRLDLNYINRLATSTPLAYWGDGQSSCPMVVQACHTSYNGAQSSRTAILRARREAALHTLAVIHQLQLSVLGQFEAILIFRQPGCYLGKAVRTNITHDISMLQAAAQVLEYQRPISPTQPPLAAKANLLNSCQKHCPAHRYCQHRAQAEYTSSAYGYHVHDLVGDIPLNQSFSDSTELQPRVAKALELYSSIFPEEYSHE